MTDLVDTEWSQYNSWCFNRPGPVLLQVYAGGMTLCGVPGRHCETFGKTPLHYSVFFRQAWSLFRPYSPGTSPCTEHFPSPAESQFLTYNPHYRHAQIMWVPYYIRSHTKMATWDLKRLQHPIRQLTSLKAWQSPWGDNFPDRLHSTSNTQYHLQNEGKPVLAYGLILGINNREGHCYNPWSEAKVRRGPPFVSLVWAPLSMETEVQDTKYR